MLNPKPSGCSASPNSYRPGERREPETAKTEPHSGRTNSLQHGCFYSDRITRQARAEFGPYKVLAVPRVRIHFPPPFFESSAFVIVLVVCGDQEFEARAISTLRLSSEDPPTRMLSSGCTEIGTGSSNSPRSARESGTLRDCVWDPPNSRLRGV